MALEANLAYYPELGDAPPPPPVVPDCQNIQDAVRVSAFARNRIAERRMMIGDSYCLVIDFNGAMDPVRTIASFALEQAADAVLTASNRIQSTSRSVSFDVAAVNVGTDLVRCTATMDNGDVWVQTVHFTVTELF